MAATSSKTMAEVLASSPSLSSSNNQTQPSSGQFDRTGTSAVESEENGPSNAMTKTFPYLTMTVYIPTACVGVLIGKRGSNIDSIQKLAAKESTKSHANGGSTQSSSRGARNKSGKQHKHNGGGGGNQKAVSPESVRISVVNCPPPPSSNAQQHPQSTFEHYQNPHTLVGDSGISSGHQQQPPMGGSPSMMDLGAPPTYTELDFSDPHWTPIVIRADPIAALYAANAIHDICCPEYVTDRNQLVYIVDVPVPAVASNETATGNANANANANLRHASIVGKRGNKLIQLSADHKCRIMVPPKQLGHNVIQLEAPLKECSSCLKAISAKLQAGVSASDEKEYQQSQPLSDTTKTSPTTPPSKNSAKQNNNNNNNAANSGKANNNGNNKNKNENNARNNCQMTLVIQPLPSQTKLRNIARKTETKILKKRIPKSQQQRHQKQQPKQDPESASASKLPPDQSSEEVEAGEQEHGGSNDDTANNSNGNGDSKVAWRLTVVASSEKKVMKAIDMLKVLNSKGYEVVVEEMRANGSNDTSNKTVSESVMGGSDYDTDGAIGNDFGGTLDGPKSASSTGAEASNGNNGKSGGRGGRKYKQRYRSNHRGNNGKDNSNNNTTDGNNSGKQQMTTTTTVGDS